MKNVKKLGTLNLSTDKLLNVSELSNYRGGSGSWNGICGVSYGGKWVCGSSGRGFNYEDVTAAYEAGGAVTGYCCASCMDDDKCG